MPSANVGRCRYNCPNPYLRPWHLQHSTNLVSLAKVLKKFKKPLTISLIKLSFTLATSVH